jgi:uncharacterized protein (DUF1778 family)
MHSNNTSPKYPRINLRVDSKQRAEIEAAADRRGVKVSEYVRDAVVVALSTEESKPGN